MRITRILLLLLFIGDIVASAAGEAGVAHVTEDEDTSPAVITSASFVELVTHRIISIQATVGSDGVDGDGSRVIAMLLYLPLLGEMEDIANAGVIHEVDIFDFVRSGEVNVRSAELELKDQSLELQGELVASFRDGGADGPETDEDEVMKINLEKVKLCWDPRLFDRVPTCVLEKIPNWVTSAAATLDPNSVPEDGFPRCQEPSEQGKLETVALVETFLKHVERSEDGSLDVVWPSKKSRHLKLGRAAIAEQTKDTIVAHFVEVNSGEDVAVVSLMIDPDATWSKAKVHGFVSTDAGLCERWLSSDDGCSLTEGTIGGEHPSVSGECTLQVSGCREAYTGWDGRPQLRISFSRLEPSRESHLTKCANELYVLHARSAGLKSSTFPDFGGVPSCE